MKNIKLLFWNLSILSCLNLNAQMNLSWAKSIGGTGADDSQTIATDLTGNVYIGGSISGIVDFDPGVGTFTLASAGATDGYVAKYDANGNFVNAVSFTNNLECKVYSLAIDNLGNVIVTGGFTGSVDFEPGPGVTQLVAGGFYDIFLVKLTSNLGFAWAHRFGYAGGDDHGFSVATDNNNNVLLTGYFQGPNIDFDPSGANYFLSSQGLRDIFILKLDANAGFLWANGFGSAGSFQEIGHTIKTDASGNVVVGGYFSTTLDFDPGVGTQTLVAAGNYDAFIAKYTSSGTYIWAKKFSSPSNEVCYALQLDAIGDVYCTGTFAGGVSCDFDPGAATFNLTSNGTNEDIFVVKLNSLGNFVWAKAFGGTSADFGRAISLDISTIYIAGYFNGIADFDPSAATSTILSNGGSDFFISRLDLSGNYISAYGYGSLGNDYSYALCSPSSGVLYAAGSFSTTVDFDAGVGTNTLTSLGSSDAYFFKLQNNTVGIEKKYSNEAIKIFPNPTSSDLNIISQKPFDIEIYNIEGALIYSQKNCDSALKLNSPFKDNGFYFIKINSDDTIYTTKIIKQ